MDLLCARCIICVTESRSMEEVYSSGEWPKVVVSSQILKFMYCSRITSVYLSPLFVAYHKFYIFVSSKVFPEYFM